MNSNGVTSSGKIRFSQTAGALAFSPPYMPFLILDGAPGINSPEEIKNLQESFSNLVPNLK